MDKYDLEILELEMLSDGELGHAWNAGNNTHALLFRDTVTGYCPSMSVYHDSDRISQHPLSISMRALDLPNPHLYSDWNRDVAMLGKDIRPKLKEFAAAQRLK